MSIAKLISSRTYFIPGRLKVSELLFDVPLDHSLPSASGESIRIFGRSVERVETPAAPATADQKVKQLPWFVYLQGGPGFGCGPPQDYPFTGLVLDRGYKVRFYIFSTVALGDSYSSAAFLHQEHAKYRRLRAHGFSLILRGCTTGCKWQDPI